jgi:hypothetical protein
METIDACNDMKNISSVCVFKIGTIIIAALLLWFQLYHIFHDPIWRDDAYFATVAKNMAAGKGYAAVYFDKNYLFHFGITGGPVLIFPAALLMLLFSNQYWVPGMAVVVIIWSLLLGIFYAAHYLVGSEKKWQFCFVALLFSFIFSLHNYGSDWNDYLGLWHLLMGDIPAALCVVLAALLLSVSPLRLKFLLAGGLMLGLAFMTKVIAGLVSAVILAVVLVQILRLQLPLRRRLLYCAAPGLMAALPVIAFEAFKLYTLGLTGYSDVLANNRKIMMMYGLTQPPDIFSHISMQLLSMVPLLEFSCFIILPFTAYLLYSAIKTPLAGKEAGARLAGIILILCFFAHSSWWIILSSGFPRYLISAFFYYFAGVSLLVAITRYKNGKKFAIVMLCLAVFATKGVIVGKYLVYDDFRPNNRLQEQLAITGHLYNFEKQGGTIFSCGNNYEIEYLMPGTNHFHYCETLAAGLFPRPAMLINYFVHPHIFVIALEEQFGGYYVEADRFNFPHCTTPYLQTAHFELNWCK